MLFGTQHEPSKWQHEEVCDGKCDIKVCLKRHPQTSLCMFHTMFEACRNKKSCKFRHVTPQPVDEDKKEEIQILQQKIHYYIEYRHQDWTWIDSLFSLDRDCCAELSW